MSVLTSKQGNRFAVAALAAVGAFSSMPATASPWVDDRGRSLSFFYPGAAPLKLQANGHDLSEAAALFRTICLSDRFDKSSVESAAAGTGWNFAYRSQMMPFKQPVDVGGWEATDAALYAADGMFFNKLAQCNLTFVPSAPASISDVQAALTAALGSAPQNADKALDKKGQPNRRYEPEWSLLQPDGSTYQVFARLSPSVKGAVHIAALKRVAK